MPTEVPANARRPFDYFIFLVIGMAVLLLAFRLGLSAPDVDDAMAIVSP